MSHVTPARLHAYANRGLDLQIVVATEEDPAEFTAIEFRAAGITKTGLVADATPDGFTVDLTLTAQDLGVVPNTYAWELVATFGGEPRTIAWGPLTVDPEITEEESS